MSGESIAAANGEFNRRLANKKPRSPNNSYSMPDVFTLNAPFFTAILVVVSLFISRYFRSDPMVRSFPSFRYPRMTLHVSSSTLSRL